MVVSPTLRNLAALSALTGFLVSCGGDVPPRERASLVLITIDTLRADRMGLYGYERPTTPNIDALAEESVVFENAISTCPSTGPSTATILTGLHWGSHAVIHNRNTLPERVATLAEVLKSHGYRTAAVVMNPVIGEKKGYAQGFDEFVQPELPLSGEREPKRNTRGAQRGFRWSQDGKDLVSATREVLARHEERPLFLWLHLIDPHGPYRAPKPFEDLFAPETYREPTEKALPESNTNYGLGVIPRYQAGRGRRMPSEYRAAYDADIRYADSHVAAIAALLRESGLWEDSILVLTADHGESLGEHDYYFQHGWHVYEGSVHVPLLLRAPGELPAGVRIAGSVSLVDLVPTVLDLLGATPSVPLDGRSLLPLVQGLEKDRPALSRTPYGNRSTAVRLGDAKYVFTPPAPEVDRRHPDGWRKIWPRRMSEELYDLGRDPDEEQNLMSRGPRAAEPLRKIVGSWLARQSELSATAQSEVTVDEAMEEQLRALGYAD